jgi:hypothetical protein
MIQMRSTTQTQDTEVAGSSRTPLLDDLRRSISGAMFRQTRKSELLTPVASDCAMVDQ